MRTRLNRNASHTVIHALLAARDVEQHGALLRILCSAPARDAARSFTAKNRFKVG